MLPNKLSIMKRAILGVLTVLTIVFCAFSQSSTNYFQKLDAFNNPPNTFSSEKELEEHLLVDESREYTASGKKFLVCLAHYLTSGTTDDRVSCWYRVPESDKLVRAWDIHLLNAGPIKFDYDPKTTRLSLIAAANIKVANTAFKGQPVASVVLSVLASR